MRRRWLSALPLVLLSQRAVAEGTDELGVTQALRAGTILGVDILDDASETIAWTGAGTVTVSSPLGVTLGTLSSGQSLSVAGSGAGAYRVVVGSQQSRGAVWDVAVRVGGQPTPGRLFSTNWQFDAGSFAQSAANNSSFYALVNGGGSAYRPVIELKLEGLAGYIYDINANTTGVDGANAGHSVPMSGNSVSPLYSIYLAPPAVANFQSAGPDVFGLAFIGGTSLDVNGQPITPCDQIAAGQSEGTFTFTSNVEGTYHLKCDLNGDGVYSGDANVDLFRVGVTVVGQNIVSWDGELNGVPVEPGTYSCIVTTQVGEFHYVGRDIETSYQGLRLYEVMPDASKRPLAMFWDDSAVQATEVNMPNGVPGAVSAGLNGMDPGSYAIAAVANVTGRAWGNFTGNGKGNNAYIDTFTYLGQSTSAVMTVEAADTTIDSDGDGASDFAESCVIGSDPNNPDTDDDGILDGQQYLGTSSVAEGGGLESNGRLSSALAERSIRASRGGMPMTLRSVGDLERMMEDVALEGLTLRGSTPTDLPLVSNAMDVAGFDFVDDYGAPQASVLIIGTEGAIYEHSKEVCDRAHGATLEEVTLHEKDSGTWMTGWFRNVRNGQATSDFATSFKLYEGETGYAWRSGWLAEDYPLPTENQKVLNVQTWARDPELLNQLVERLEVKWSQSELLAPTASVAALDPETDEQLAESFATPSVPVYFRHGAIFGTTLDFATFRRENLQGASLRVVGLGQDGKEQLVEIGALGDELSKERAVELPLFADATVELVSADGAEVLDRMWLSDGTWTRFDDSLWGGASKSNVSLDCAWSEATPGAKMVSGCAYADIESVETQAGVARHFLRGIALQDGDGLQADVDLSRDGKLCVESSVAEKAQCWSLPKGASRVTLAASDIDADIAGSVDFVSFYVEAGGPATVEARGLSVVRDVDESEGLGERAEVAAEESDGSVDDGCSVSEAGAGRKSSSFAALVTLALAWLGRARSSRKSAR